MNRTTICSTALLALALAAACGPPPETEIVASEPEALTLQFSPRDRFSLLMRPDDAVFAGTTMWDMSRWVTRPRNQSSTGDCVGFSTVAAVEAAFLRKYCLPGTANDFRSRGYCQRFDAMAATPPQTFQFTRDYAAWNSDNYLTNLKELDLSELFAFHRQRTQQATATTAVTENVSTLTWGYGVVPGTVGDMMNGYALAEEADAPFVVDEVFWAPGPDGIYPYVQNNWSQSKSDAIEFSDTFMNTLIVGGPRDPKNRPMIPTAARKNARFRVNDYYTGSLAAIGDRAAQIRFLERAVYSGYAIALHAAPGHSMLLVGYDRVQRRFHLKDHYVNWSTLDYDTFDSNGSYTVILDVSYEQPSTEEMWLGRWNVSWDGIPGGELILRRTRPPTNANRTLAQYLDQTQPPLSKQSWARVGSYLWQSVPYTVYGRLGDDDDRTIELAIDKTQREIPNSTLAQHAAGFNVPAGAYRIQLNVASTGVNTAAVATGRTNINGAWYPVVLRRADRALVATQPPVVPSTSAPFSAAQLVGTYRVRMPDDQLATLTLTATTATLTTGGVVQTLARTPYQDNALYLSSASLWMDLRYSTHSQGELSGIDGHGNPLVAVRIN